MRLFLKTIKKSILHFSWDLAIASCSTNEDGYLYGFNKYRVLKNPYKDKWFADPFILSCDDEFAEVLVEEFDKNVGKGRVAQLRIDIKKAVIVNCSILLDLDTHLSYPMILKRDNKIFVLPENSKSGSWDVYEYMDSRLVKLNRLIDKPLTDATLAQIEGEYYVFATQAPNPNGNILSIYHSVTQFGPFSLLENVRFKEQIARMGGDFFSDTKGNLVRVAQDCNKAYGRKVLFQKIKKTGTHFSFETIGELSPGRKYAGLHTYNQKDGLLIIDLKKYDFPIISVIRGY